MKQVKCMHQISIDTLCEYILNTYGVMCYSKLQKLAFYCDAYHLAYFEQMLVFESFESHPHGVICNLHLKEYGGERILFCDVSFKPENKLKYEFDISQLADKQKELITDVLSALSKWSDGELESALHKEQPYLSALHTTHKVINKVETMHYYKTDIS